MQQLRPIYVTSKSGFRLTPHGAYQLHAYAQFYVNALRAKLDEYLRELDHLRAHGEPEDESATLMIAETTQAIKEATECAKEVEALRQQIEEQFTITFKLFGDAYRQTRRQLGLARIEDDASLWAAVQNTMAALKDANKRFNEVKFTTYINN
jgi:hypothetical protein